MFILKKGHQPGVYVPLRALFLVILVIGKAQFRRAMLSCDSSCLGLCDVALLNDKVT